jgi:hypothetical protein
MSNFDHQVVNRIWEKRLAEPHSDSEREMLLKLLADEEAKQPPLKNGILKRR